MRLLVLLVLAGLLVGACAAAACGGGPRLAGVCFHNPASFATIHNLPNATACACACEAEPRCNVWTYRAPGTEPNHLCLLKGAGGDVRRSDPLCTSGQVRVAPPPSPPSPPSPPQPPQPPLPPRNPGRKPPAYWCTWQAQSREWMQGAALLNASGGEDFWLAWRQHDPPPNDPVSGYSGWDKFLNQTYVFQNAPVPAPAPAQAPAAPQPAEVGWAYLFKAATRRGLYFSLDNNWASHDGGLDTGRFPDLAVPKLCSREVDKVPCTFPGIKHPGQATCESAGCCYNASLGANACYKRPSPLGALVAEVKGLGWAGLSVWVPGGATAAQLDTLHVAGVGILKVDGGDEACSVTQLARVHAPNLWVEHGFCGPDCPLNGPLNGTGAGRWPLSMAEHAVRTLNCSDSFRSYDMVKSLSVVEVIDRQSKLYALGASLPRHTPDSETPRRFVGGSGEHMVTAALGGVIQPMDSNTRGLIINPAYSVYVNGPPGRNRQNREDEIARCVAWSNIVPPFGAGVQPGGRPDDVVVDSEILWDSWKFAMCDDACTLHRHLINKTVANGAPARVTRGGLALPAVAMPSRTTPPPFVLATRFPNGSAVLLTSLGRTTPSRYTEPEAHVNLTIPPPDDADNADSPASVPMVGIFGRFASVTLHFESGCFRHGGEAASVSARDMLAAPSAATKLAAPEAVWVDAATLRLDGAALARIGTGAKGREDDMSLPGLILEIAV